MLKLFRLTQVIELLDGAIKLPTLKKYCHDGKVEYSMSPGRGLRYMTQAQVDKLFLIIKKKD
jgi:predicted site-specific integrase-resolvase